MNSKLLFCWFAIWISVVAIADAHHFMQRRFERYFCAVLVHLLFFQGVGPIMGIQARSLFNKRCLMVEVSASQLVATNREALFACLDDIGTYVLFPTNAYWNELEDAKAAFLDFQATNTYARTPGIVRAPWSYSHIEGTGCFGDAVHKRWEPVLSRNKEIERYRHKVLAAFKPAVQQHLSSMPQEMQATFRTNIVTRAALTAEEAGTLFAQ